MSAEPVNVGVLSCVDLDLESKGTVGGISDVNR